MLAEPAGFENLFITFTSYADYDRLHFAKLIKLMGELLTTSAYGAGG